MFLPLLRRLRRQRTRGLLLLLESALSVVLLTGAALTMTSVWRLQQVDLGFDTEPLLVAGLDLPREGGPALAVTLASELLERIGGLQGVLSASLAVPLPLTGSRNHTTFEVEGASALPLGTKPEADYCIVTAGYFRTLGIGVLRGREFSSADRLGTPRVVIVDEILAQRLWAGADPIGRRIRRNGPEGLWSGEVVGVVQAVSFNPREKPSPTLYWAFAQDPASSPALLIRSAGRPGPLAAAVRRQILASDRDLQLYDVQTMDELLAGWASTQRYLAFLFAAFGAAGLVLTATGVYGVMSYLVSSRSREISLRLSLGARRSDVLKMVLFEGGAFVLPGIAAGLLIAQPAARILATFLPEVDVSSPLAFAGTAVLLLAVALLATLMPARLAARINPANALRGD